MPTLPRVVAMALSAACVVTGVAIAQVQSDGPPPHVMPRVPELLPPAAIALLPATSRTATHAYDVTLRCHDSSWILIARRNMSLGGCGPYDCRPEPWQCGPAWLR